MAETSKFLGNLLDTPTPKPSDLISISVLVYNWKALVFPVANASIDCAPGSVGPNNGFGASCAVPYNGATTVKFPMKSL